MGDSTVTPKSDRSVTLASGIQVGDLGVDVWLNPCHHSAVGSCDPIDIARKSRRPVSRVGVLAA